MGSGYRPQSSGQVERMNQQMEQVLRCLISENGTYKNWDSLLPTVAFIINSLPAQATGYSPFYLNYGFHPTTPVEMLRDFETSHVESVNDFTRRMTQLFKSV